MVLLRRLARELTERCRQLSVRSSSSSRRSRPSSQRARPVPASRSAAAGRSPPPRSSARPPASPLQIRHAYARHNGTAPLPVWSSDKQRHRLSRTGNRQLNAALHRIALTQARWHPDAKAMIDRRRATGTAAAKRSASSNAASPTSSTTPSKNPTPRRAYFLLTASPQLDRGASKLSKPSVVSSDFAESVLAAPRAGRSACPCCGAVLVVADALGENVDDLRVDERHPWRLVDDLACRSRSHSPRAASGFGRLLRQGSRRSAGRCCGSQNSAAF